MPCSVFLILLCIRVLLSVMRCRCGSMLSTVDEEVCLVDFHFWDHRTIATLECLHPCRKKYPQRCRCMLSALSSLGGFQVLLLCTHSLLFLHMRGALAGYTCSCIVLATHGRPRLRPVCHKWSSRSTPVSGFLRLSFIIRILSTMSSLFLPSHTRLFPNHRFLHCSHLCRCPG